VDEEKKKQFQGLLDLLKQKLPEVKDVRLTNRLKESAACLVAGEGEAGAYMERILERMGRLKEAPPTKRVLEVNPDHAVLGAMLTIHGRDAADPRLEKYARLLYDQAVLAEGSKVKDPAALARRINELLVKDATT
jgi:molecular chaperone HtpG